MKRKVLIFCLVLLSVTGITNVYAQRTSEISLDLGAGTADIFPAFRISHFFDDDYAAFSQIGARYISTSANNKVSLYSGLTLDVLDGTYFLKIPAGIRFNYGNKIKFHIGAGLNYGICLNREFFQPTIGAFMNFGPSFRLTKNYRLMLSTQTNMDITPLDQDESHSMGGSHTGPDIYWRGYYRFIVLSLYKTIKIPRRCP